MKPKHEPLTATDAAWFRMEERRNPVDIGSLMLFDGELSEQRLRAVISERLLVHPRFSQRVVDTRLGLTPPHWEDEPGFSLDRHLHRAALPAGAGLAELQAFVGAVMSEPMDMTRSPWLLYLVDGLERGTALVSRIHHCMGDGFALMQILLSLADSDDSGSQAATHEAPKPPTPSGSREASEMAHHRIASLSHLAGDAVRALGHLLLLPFDPQSSLRAPLGGTRRVAWSEGIALSRVKAIGRSRGATVNDVLLTAVTGGLRRYLADRGDPVDDLTLRAIVPVNLRPPDQPIDLEHGNWFGLLFVELPVHEKSAGARARALEATIDRIKRSQEGIVSLGVLNAMGRAPAAVEHVLDDVFARKGSLVVTNVPGPRKRLTLAGSRLDDMMFWAPHSGGLGLGVSILSYAGTIRIGIRSDAAVVPDPGVLARSVEREIDRLEAGTQAGA